jgi:hypothetical protein
LLTIVVAPTADLCTISRIVLAGPGTFHELIFATAARTGTSDDEILAMLINAWIEKVCRPFAFSRTFADARSLVPTSSTTCHKAAKGNSRRWLSPISSQLLAPSSLIDYLISSPFGRAYSLRQKKRILESMSRPPFVICPRELISTVV